MFKRTRRFALPVPFSVLSSVHVPPQPGSKGCSPNICGLLFCQLQVQEAEVPFSEGPVQNELSRVDFVPSGPSGFECSQHSPTIRPSVERTAEKAFLLSDRVKLSSAEARVERMITEFKVGSVGVLVWAL